MLANRYLLTHQEKHLRETFVFLDLGIDRKTGYLASKDIRSFHQRWTNYIYSHVSNYKNIHIYRYIHTYVYTLEVNHDSKLVLPFG